MHPHSLIRPLTIPAAALALAASAFSAHAETGARVVLQTWNPLTPEQSHDVTLLDEPAAVSDALQTAWARARPRICRQLRDRMGVGGAARGETLHDITCLLDERATLDITPAGSNALRARFAFGGYIEASSTTPDIALGIGLDRDADPRFSIALTATIDMAVVVQADRNATLRVSKATFVLGNAVVDSHGLTGDIAKFVAEDLSPFFGGPDYRRMAEDAVNAVSVGFANDVNGALAPVNARLVGPSDAIRVGLEARDHYVSVAFAARDIRIPSNGRMSGVLRWDAATFTPRHGCASFDITATVQTGPAPLFAQAGVAPTRQVGTFRSSPLDASSCAFTLTGLAEGWPNRLASRVLDPPVSRSAGNANTRTVFMLASDGWNGRAISPQPAADGRDYRVLTSTMRVAELVGPGDVHRLRDERIDPLRDPTVGDPSRGVQITNQVTLPSTEASPALANRPAASAIRSATTATATTVPGASVPGTTGPVTAGSAAARAATAGPALRTARTSTDAAAAAVTSPR